MSKQRMQGNNFLNKQFLFAAFVLLAVAVFVGSGDLSTTAKVHSGVHSLGDANLDGVVDDKDLELFLDLKKSCVEGQCTLPVGMNSLCSNVDKDPAGKLTENDYDEFMTKIFVGEQDLGSC